MPTSTRRGFLGSLGAGLALGELSLRAQAPGNAPNAARDAANVERDVVFGKGGDVDLVCDIVKPPAGAPTKRMALIHLHGGGFAGGNKNFLAARLQPISALGYVNIASQYRLSGEARWPAQINDVKAAIRWTRANASRLGIDPARIAVTGYSAGGYLSIFAAATQNQAKYEGNGGNANVPSAVAACVSYFPVTGVASWPSFRTGLPLPPNSTDADWQEVELSTHVKNLPPTVLFHGMTDTTVAPEHSANFLKLMQGASIPSELHTFAGVPHEFVGIPEFADTCARLIDFFMERHVINPRTYPPFGAGRRGGGAPGPGGPGGRPGGEPGRPGGSGQ